MAKSPGEQFREIFAQLAVLTERDATRQQEITELYDLVKSEQAERIRLQVENAALKQQLQDHVAHSQESDRRKWGLFTGLILALVGAVLSLASGLIVALNKK